MAILKPETLSRDNFNNQGLNGRYEVWCYSLCKMDFKTLQQLAYAARKGDKAPQADVETAIPNAWNEETNPHQGYYLDSCDNYDDAIKEANNSGFCFDYVAVIRDTESEECTVRINCSWITP